NGNNFRNANNHLRRDWQRHVFASRSGDWHRDWDRHCDHWWNGHRCSFINGSWVIFSNGFDPWWPWAWTPPDYFAYGSPYSGYNYNYPDYGEGYYNGESDGSVSAEMRQALRRYQRAHGLALTGYLDGDTLALMGLR